MSTPAIRQLEESGTDFEVHSYQVDEAVGDGYGEAVALAIGVDQRVVFKTLVAMVDGEHVLAVIPVGERLSMKKLAHVVGGRKAEMASTVDAERLTGYVVGGISPLGLRRALRAFLDESAAENDRIFVSAGKRGLQIEVGADALSKLARAEIARLT